MCCVVDARCLKVRARVAGARVGVESGPAQHLAALRGPRLPLPHQRGLRREGYRHT